MSDHHTDRAAVGVVDRFDLLFVAITYFKTIVCSPHLIIQPFAQVHMFLYSHYLII